METVKSIAELEERKEKNDLLLVYFGSESCGVCRDMMPKLEQMLQAYPGIQAVRIDTQSLPELSAAYHVFSVPVVMLFIQGKETIREAGIISLPSLEQRIARYERLFSESRGNDAWKG